MSTLDKDDLKDILTAVASRAGWEAEWLDLLSQLEYVGCRKIIKAIPYHQIDESVLQHVSEEASHAFLLKAAARKRGLDTKSWGESGLSEIGWRYFSRLDESVSALEGAEGMRYPAVSWAIERRVLAVYPAYAEITCDPAVKGVLARILAQEERHGAQFNACPFSESFRARVLEAEGPLWFEFRGDLVRYFSPHGQGKVKDNSWVAHSMPS